MEMDKCFMKKRYLIIISFLILGSFCWLNFKIDNSAKDIIGVYIEGEYSNSVPLKDSDYYVEKIECDNGSLGEWDYVNWGLLTTNMSKKSKCNVYFRKDTIVEAIKDELDTTGKCPSVNADGSINVTSAESENSLLCSAPDNYGTSYYYRGNVQNNYVYFAGFYWRIVRINGDGSIRIIYDGTVAHKNGEASEDRIIGTSTFNEKCDDNAYVGYMYGTPGSSTYEETHANINDSTIKKYVDSWYENNLKGTNFENYIVDNIFCDNRILIDEGNGTGNTSTNYKWPGSNNYNVTLKCIQKNDSLTVSNIMLGTASLKYPISLLSSEEATLNGGYKTGNEKYFLYTGTWYYFNGALIHYNDGQQGYAHVTHNNLNGGIYNDYNYVLYNGGVKPVINLKQGALKSGNGTITDAYLTD